MATGKLHAKLTFGLPSSNTVSQAFDMKLDYAIVSSGTIDVATAANSGIDIPFGGTSSAQGVVVKNLTNKRVELAFNGGTKAYAVAPGGMFMHWAPEAAGADELTEIEVTPKEPTEDGTIEFVVLGA